MGRLDGKVALITGGAGDIGAATAKRFIEENCRVVISDRDVAKGRAVSERLGEHCLFVAGDHLLNEDNRRAVDTAVSAFGGLDILFNNAGIARTGPLDSLSDEDFDAVMAVNVTGPHRMTKTALPALRARSHSGHDVSILFTASIQTLLVRPNFTAYGASKHAIGGFLASLALELAGEGIRVNGVCPGPVDTPLLQDALRAIDDDLDATRERFRKGVPLQRLAEATDVANAVLFLASGEARHITGVLLPVDGGQTAR